MRISVAEDLSGLQLAVRHRQMMTRQLRALKSAIEILESIQNGAGDSIAEQLDRIEEIKAAYHCATDTAVITAHPHMQLKIEVFDDERCAYAVESFNSMIEARSWLSQRGVRDESITLRVEQACNKPADASGYLGIFRCAHCKDSCVEESSTPRSQDPA
jgi:hypothetical protein